MKQQKLEYLSLSPDNYLVAKIYPQFTRIYEYKIQVEDLYWFAPENRSKRLKMANKIKYNDTDSELDSIRRTKTLISDLMICNEFDMFATFTFNGSKKYARQYGYAITDRTDIDLLKTKMQKWLKNQRDIHGKFQYLIVPEYHKDGKALHFHALLKGYKGTLFDTGKTKGARPIYNISSYKLGHSTVIPIDDNKVSYRKVSSYIKKYITKDMPQFRNKKRYWSSQGLNKPLKVPNPNIENTHDFKKTYSFRSMSLFVSEKRIDFKEYLNTQQPNVTNREVSEPTYSYQSLKLFELSTIPRTERV